MRGFWPSSALSSSKLRVFILFFVCMRACERDKLSALCASSHTGSGNPRYRYAETVKEHASQDSFKRSLAQSRKVFLMKVAVIEGNTPRDGVNAVGSKPPSCISKCNGCHPCVPLRISVPPGNPSLSEYYPEAWRCKCHGKFYMP
ncbi:hypothetical protein KP509_15G042300 [Ceratopteris richardii]|uniref:Epidermal patterning factor-like protein n=1 Tax=Ceratopteris richardii TaxID=49495 RepID=A0A8T2T6H6_CERRI|nr:hypothetical protein KP509_15G042300 [Ceratopteris richardii]